MTERGCTFIAAGAASLVKGLAGVLLVAAALPALGQVVDRVSRLRQRVADGYLLVFGPTHRELRTRTGNFVMRILHGEAPGDMAIEQTTQFELAINLKTAKASGQTIPHALLQRGDEVLP